MIPRRAVGVLTVFTLALSLGSVGGAAAAAPAGTFAFLQTRDGGFSYAMYAVGTARGAPRRISLERAVGRPAISPDGQQVVFSSPLSDDSDGRYGLFTVSMNGFGLRQITAPQYADSDPAWSPDGQWIAFSRDYSGNSDPLTCCRLVLARANGSAARALPGILGATYPTWSPDGGRLAFVTPRGLWVVTRTGTGLRRIAEGRLGQPAWSPDGRLIAYTQRVTEDQTQLRTIPSGGGRAAVRYAANGHVDSPNWDADSRTLYFISHRGAGEGSRVSSAIQAVVLGQRPRVLYRYAQQVYYLAFSRAQARRGTTTAGVARPVGATYDWSLANAPLGADLARRHAFAPVGSTPLSGDWNGDGRATSGYVTVNGAGTRLVWFLSDDNGTVSKLFEFGAASDRPIVGDWDGDGQWSAGVARSNNGRLDWLLTDDNRTAKPTFTFGYPGDQIVAGDWNSDGTTTVGTVRPILTNLAWYLTDNNASISRRFTFGSAGTAPELADRAIAGDWNADGRWTAGIVRGAGAVLQWQLTDDDVTIVQDFLAGVPGDIAVVGDWDGGLPTA